MKRILWLCLIALLLCGCTMQQTEETVAPIPETTVQILPEPTETVGIYESHSDLEIQTGGAVRYYLPQVADAYGMRIMNGDVLVFSGPENTTLTRYTGQQLYAVAEIALDCRIDPEETSFQISENGITYFNPETRELVFLDNELKEVRRLAMPSDLTGKPVLSSDRMLVFYCTADAVWVLDTTTGLNRLLKSVSYPRQSVEAVLAEDSVLRCSLTDVQGWEYQIFISTQDGHQMAELQYEAELATGDGYYYVKTRDGVLDVVLFGQDSQETQALHPLDAFAQPWILAQSHGVVTASVSEGATGLDYYDLESGLRTASVALPGGIRPMYMESQSSSAVVWLMAYDPMASGAVVLRWDRNASETGDETDYTGSHYTAEIPDEAGLAECAALAEAIGQKYGVRILLGRDATAEQPWDYSLEYEYQVPVIRRELAELEQVLSQFPEGFFTKLHTQPNICIVRSIRGNAASGSLDNAGGVQFWAGEKAYVVLAAGESLVQSFYHEMFHMIDSQVLSTTRTYYYWHNLNPAGCEYFQDYTSYLDADVSEYLQEENRVFIDAYSMSYPREDRARIMEYACMDGNAHYFQSEVMQSKLKTLCQGIREAFGLEKYEGSLLWEQYLSEPLKIK